MKKRTLALLLCAVMMLGLAACGKEPAGSGSASGDLSGDVSGAVSTPAPETVVNVMAMTGPTGVGAAKLMADSAAAGDGATYNFSVVAANDEVGAALAKGEVDIACIATPVAANLYNKTGNLTVLAVNTLGVLYIMEKGNTVTDVASLRGKTIYATGQGANPEFVLNHLLTSNGLDPATDVDIQWMTAQEVTAKMVQSTDGVCLLPVPAATALMVKDSTVREALNVGTEWDKVSQSPLVMGCAVVRNAFLQEHPELVEQFLADYEASINYMTDEANLAAGAEYVAQFGIAANAAIAAKAIPQCNLVFISGTEMRDAIQSYYEVLFEANPASIGGGIPDDGFYYIP
ncbi:MAG: ABC transporter substrate-binding protein [Ruminococcaceae bacterium]|nr:ABC transporter substrate-binding protein [Oscillospiraceae bacterium]